MLRIQMSLEVPPGREDGVAEVAGRLSPVQLPVIQERGTRLEPLATLGACESQPCRATPGRLGHFKLYLRTAQNGSWKKIEK